MKEHHSGMSRRDARSGIHPLRSATWVQRARIFPLFNGVALTQSGGSSIYHGMSIQAERRISRGLSFNANYTWAKALTDVSLTNYAKGFTQKRYTRFLDRGEHDWLAVI